MAENLFLVNDGMIANMSLMVLKTKLRFLRTVGSDYSSQFGNKAVIQGSTHRIRKPPKYVATEGAVYVAQENVEEETDITISQSHVGLKAITLADRTFRIGGMEAFRRKFIDPAAAPLGASADFKALATVQDVWNIVGTPGTAPGDLRVYMEAGIRLLNEGVPEDGLWMCVGPNENAQVIKENQGLFHSGDQLEDQYKKAIMGFAAGFEWIRDPHVHRHTSGDYGAGTPAVNDTVAEGATTIITDAWPINKNPLLTVADHFSIAGVNAVVAQTREDAAYPRTFVMTAIATSDGTGNATLSFQPPMFSTGPLKNVTALPADDALITPFGPALTTSTYSVAYHPDAFGKASPDLELPMELKVASRAREEESGLSLTYTSQFQIEPYTTISRLDMMLAVKCQYPELACIVAGGALPA